MADKNFDNLTVNGHVGIGTTAPHGTLDVKTTADQHLVFNANGNGSDPGAFGIVATNDADNAFVPLNLSASRFACTTGYVGLNTTSPGVLLDVNMGTTYTAQARFSSNGGDAAISLNNTAAGGHEYWLDSGTSAAAIGNTFSIYDRTVDAARLSISTSGNVGIGTTTPGAMLDVGGVYSGTLHVANGTAGAFQIIGIGNTGNLILNNANTVGGDIDIQSRGKSALYIKNDGSVNVPGDVILTGQDCAEDFDIAPDIHVEPGTVMVVDENGALQPGYQEYDKRVAGVISGAGDLKAGIILGKQTGSSNRQPIALVGKVYCKVDAEYGPIKVGDLLTTAPTLGHAMKAGDPQRAFGAVIGKARQTPKPFVIISGDLIDHGWPPYSNTQTIVLIYLDN